MRSYDVVPHYTAMSGQIDGSLGFPANCDPPAELDWDFHVGPAPMQPYRAPWKQEV